MTDVTPRELPSEPGQPLGSARVPTPARVLAFLRDELGGHGEDAAIAARLAEGCASVTLAAGEVHVPSDRAGASVRFVLDGLIVLRAAADTEPPVAVAAGGAFVLGAGAVVIATLPSALLAIDAAAWQAAVGPLGTPFETWRDALGVSFPVGSIEPSVGIGQATEGRDALLRMSVANLMSPNPVALAPERPIREAAALMRERRLSCLPLVEDGALVGIVTESDMTGRVVATGRSVEAPLRAIMTPDPLSIDAGESVFELLSLMSRRRISHVPVTRGGEVAGIVTHGDIVRRRSASPVFLIERIARLDTPEALAGATTDVPRMLADLVDAGGDATSVGRLVTAVTDALTQRLVALAIDAQGPPPCRFAWLACGSQGRREQSGVSDQDNALVLDEAYDEAAHGAWFERFARFVSDGLAAAGYVYCPGEMMATTPRWRQPLRVWRRYFSDWIAEPGTEAQMLASVMFDLRVIDGEEALFEPLRREVLDTASANGLFVAHMVACALTHRPPIGLFNRLTRTRRGAFRGRIDLKAGGIVPIVDLGRLHALAAALPAVATLERLQHAREHGSDILSTAGARDLIDVWETVSELRLAHQARQVRRGEPPDNHVDPGALSRLERERLRDALLAVRDIQAALGNRHATIGR